MNRVTAAVVVALALAAAWIDRPARAAGTNGPFPKPGFVTRLEAGRLWVFREGSDALAIVEAGGELQDHTTQIGGGPAGLTVKAPDRAVLLEYLAAKPGFVALAVEDRLWVFRADSPELDRFRESGAPAEHVTRVNAGPLDTTVKAPDAETLDAYLCYKTGFAVFLETDAMWVFHEGSNDLRRFEAGGVPAGHAEREGAGPGGRTIRAPDAGTIVDYITKLDGFETFVNYEGRLWVFRQFSPELEQFYETGQPEKHVTFIGAGPLGLTIKAPDRETATAYLRTYAASP